MIPKIIHYCWFGKNKYPAIVQKCVASWHKYCPDYEIKLWNEDNYDVKKNMYMIEAYKNKKWAFVSDFARLDIIYKEGGIYLDADVELVRSLDDLLEEKCFVAGDGMGINTGLGFGAEKEHTVVKEMLDLYEGKHFITAGVPDLTPCTVLNTKPFVAWLWLRNDSPTILGVAIYLVMLFGQIPYITDFTHYTRYIYCLSA